MIVYVPMVHFHYDDTVPAESPVVGYHDRDTAERVARERCPLRAASPEVIDVIVREPFIEVG